MEEFDLLPPGAQARNPTTPEAQPNPWMDWLQRPENRAMLIGIGTNMMTGGWGGGMQQLGAALGAGAEARAGTVAAAQQQEALGRQEDFRERELTQRGQIASEDRAGRENVARIGADSRTQVAEIRGQYGLLRAQQAGARSAQEQATYSRLFNSRAQELERGNLLRPVGQQMTGQQIMDEAAAYADRAFAAHRQQQPPTPGPGGGPPAPGAPPPGSLVAPAPGTPPPALTPQGPPVSSLYGAPAEIYSRPGSKGSIQPIPGGGPMNRPAPTPAPGAQSGVTFEQWVQQHGARLQDANIRAQLRQLATQQGNRQTLDYLTRFEQLQGAQE